MGVMMNVTQNKIESIGLLNKPQASAQSIVHPTVIYRPAVIIDSTQTRAIPRTGISYRKIWSGILGKLGRLLNILNMSSLPKDMVDPEDVPEENSYDRAFPNNFSERLY